MGLLKGKALNWAITAAAGAGFLLFGYGRYVDNSESYDTNSTQIKVL